MADDTPQDSGPITDQHLTDFISRYQGDLDQDTAALGKLTEQSQPQPFTQQAPQRDTGVTAVAPFLIGLTALAGKGLGIHSKAMLGATNGMMQGLIQGSEQKYKDQKAAYDTAYQQWQDKWTQQQKLYNEMRQVYKGRIDADLRALQFARQVSGDQARVTQNDLKNHQQAEIIADKFQRTNAMIDHNRSMESIRQMEAQRKAQAAAQKAVGFGGPVGQLMAALADRGVALPAGFRSKEQQLGLMQGLIARHPGQTPDQIADGIKSGQISFSAEKKETQTAAGIAGRVAVAEQEIQKFAPTLLQASRAIPRGKFVPVNRLLQMGETDISDPALRQLRVYINSMLNAYDVLAARGGTDVKKREEAHGLITSADSPEALEAGVRAFQKEAELARQSAQAAEGRASPQAGGSEPLRKTVDGNSYVSPDNGTTWYRE